jgi:Rrf2 family nitric oxide-sensitive transcriptional repressor
MQLSKFSDYALRIVMHLANSPDQLLSTRQLAEIHHAKFNHLSKVSGWLVAHDYAHSLRGRGGGLRLARPPSEISLGQLLRRLEEDKPLVECMGADGGQCRLSPACGLSLALQKAQEAFFKELDPITLEGIPQLSPSMGNLLRALNAEALTLK